MKEQVIDVSTSRQEIYSVIVGFQSLKGVGSHVERSRFQNRDIFALVDETVAGLHLGYLTGVLDPAVFDLEIITIPPGEHNKNIATYMNVVDELVARGMQRRTLLLLVGGGVTMDMGGLIGATFMRGVPVINIPTTLVAQIDAAIGGKVAVNHAAGKNLIGAFYNPQLVLVDPYFLSTLSASHIRDGLAEVIKTAVIACPELFRLIEDSYQRVFQQDPATLQQLISLTIQTKADLLRDDPLELNLQRVLNFGHTLAHPLETVYHYQGLSHGEAVAIGISASVRYATRNGFCSFSTGDRIIQLLRKVGLPTEVSLGNHRHGLVSALQTVMRIRNGALNFVIPREIGDVAILEQVNIPAIVSCLGTREGDLL